MFFKLSFFCCILNVFVTADSFWLVKISGPRNSQFSCISSSLRKNWKWKLFSKMVAGNASKQSVSFQISLVRPHTHTHTCTEWWSCHHQPATAVLKTKQGNVYSRDVHSDRQQDNVWPTATYQTLWQQGWMGEDSHLHLVNRTSVQQDQEEQKEKLVLLSRGSKKCKVF